MTFYVGAPRRRGLAAINPNPHPASRIPWALAVPWLSVPRRDRDTKARRDHKYNGVTRCDSGLSRSVVKASCVPRPDREEFRTPITYCTYACACTLAVLYPRSAPPRAKADAITAPRKTQRRVLITCLQRHGRALRSRSRRSTVAGMQWKCTHDHGRDRARDGTRRLTG